MASPGRPAVVAAGFGLAAAFCAWHPLAAPFGLVLGIVSIFLAIRGLRAGGRRAFAAAGLALSVLAVAASVLVLALTAGVGRDLGGEPVVAGPTREESGRTLDEAAAATRPARERALKELSGADRGGEGGGH